MPRMSSCYVPFHIYFDIICLLDHSIRRDKIRREIIISSAKITLKNNLDNNWRSHVVLSVQLILHWKWNARSLHDREPVKTRRHIHTRVHLFFAHFLLVPVCFSSFFSTIFVFYSFESQLKCINFIDGFIWNALVNKLHKWHGQDDYDDVDVVNSDYHVYSCTHLHSNYNVLYRKIASIVIIIRTFLLLHFLEYLYSVCTLSIAMHCTALHTHWMAVLQFANFNMLLFRLQITND